MITEELEQYNHKKTPLSSNVSEDTSSRAPHGGNEYGESQHRTTGHTQDLIELFGSAIEEAEEFKGTEPTTDKPRLVTRGPHSYPPTQQKQFTKLDTLSFTAKEPYWIVQQLVEVSCPGSTFIKLKYGKNGYHSGFSVIKDKRELAQIYYGSLSNDRQNERPQLIIGGNGKTDEFNFEVFHYWATFMESPKITRADICLDIFDGSLTIEQVAQAHIDGQFKALKANKNPRITPYGQIQPDGTNPGRTLYIGSLSSSKSVRFYEKGFEMFKSILNSEEKKDEFMKDILEESFKDGKEMSFDGINDNKPFDISKWLRAEVQLRNANCDIPLDLLIKPDEYFAGSYPYLKELLSINEGKTPPRFKTQDEIQLAIRIANHKAITGSLIEDLRCLGWTDTDIVEALTSGKGASQKLIRSGAYKDC